METTLVVAIIIAVPVILIPLALLWQLNFAGIRSYLRHKSGR